MGWDMVAQILTLWPRLICSYLVGLQGCTSHPAWFFSVAVTHTFGQGYFKSTRQCFRHQGYISKQSKLPFFLGALVQWERQRKR